MIKRRFYRLEHGDRDAPSESSSSSDSEVEAEATDETEVEEEEEEEEEEEYEVGEVRKKEGASSSSGYESEDSSVNDINLDSSGLPTSDDDVTAQSREENLLGSLSRCEKNNSLVSNQQNPEKDEIELDVAECVLKCKSVFKCRLCPRIVCLSEETLKAHLNSKRHARSEKLHREGRLKHMLNDEGKIEGETRPEKHATTTVPGQMSDKSRKKGKGRLKQMKRLVRKETRMQKARESTEHRGKRRKNDC